MEGAARCSGDTIVPALLAQYHGVHLKQEAFKAQLGESLQISKKMESFPCIVGGLSVPVQKIKGLKEELHKPIWVEITAISPSHFGQKYLTFDGYYVNDLKTDTLPVVGDVQFGNVWFLYSPRSFYISIVQKADTEEALLKDYYQMEQDFVLKAKPR